MLHDMRQFEVRFLDLFFSWYRTRTRWCAFRCSFLNTIPLLRLPLGGCLSRVLNQGAYMYVSALLIYILCNCIVFPPFRASWTWYLTAARSLLSASLFFVELNYACD